MPIDFVFGPPKIIQITDHQNPDLKKFTSINLTGLLELAPPEGITSSEYLSITPDFTSKNGIVEVESGALVTVEASSDLQNWVRVQSIMTEDQGERKIQLPTTGFQKGFYRAKQHSLAD